MILSRGYRNPVLLLHPLGGWTKADDVPLKVSYIAVCVCACVVYITLYNSPLVTTAVTVCCKRLGVCCIATHTCKTS